MKFSYRLVSTVVISLWITLGGCKNETSLQGKATVEELASVLGVQPFISEIQFASPRYGRLVQTTSIAGDSITKAISTDGPDTNFRIRIFLVSDPKSGATQKIIYSISGKNSGGGGRNDYFEPETSPFRRSAVGKTSFEFEFTDKQSKSMVWKAKFEASDKPFPKNAL